MLNRRARGLISLYLAVIAICEGAFFWIYAELIYRVTYIRLSRDVNLIPYFLCVMGGIALSVRDCTGLVDDFFRLDFSAGAKLAGKQVALAALLIFTMMFATQDHSISRAFLGSFLVFSWIGLAFANCYVPRGLSTLIYRTNDRVRTIVVGPAVAVNNLRVWIASREALGVHTVGIVSDDRSSSFHEALPAPWLGRFSDLGTIILDNKIGQVIMLEVPSSGAATWDVINICRDSACRLLIYSNLGEHFSASLIPVTEGGRHFYTLHEEPLENPVNRLAKRAFDLAISIPVVLGVLPLLCVWVWIMQRIESPGPLFHARTRLGLQGRSFRMEKFRSMYPAPPDASSEAKQAESVDSRIFPFGRFMRKTSLDEFPQFWNVLIGDMSIVGPRPYMPILDEAFRTKTGGYKTRSLVKPGITGLAQSKGFRGAILEQEMLERRLYWDIHYVTHWSLFLDLQIMASTLLQVIRPPATAY